MVTTTSFDSTLQSLGIKRSATTAASGTSLGATGKGAEQMNQSDFIALMTAQMKNQDPFNPVDNTQMVAQMAQFSSLAGISEMSSTLKSIATKLGAATPSDALAYVGKTVLTAGNTAYPRAAGGLAGAVELASDATSVNLTIANANGEVLKTVNLGAHAAGTLSYDWDGTTDSGAPAGAGPFTITSNAHSATKSIPSTNLVWAPVTSVSMPSGGDPVLTLPGVGQVTPAAVRSIA